MVLEGGTLTSWQAGRPAPLVQLLCSRNVGRSERTASARCWVLRDRARSLHHSDVTAGATVHAAEGAVAATGTDQPSDDRESPGTRRTRIRSRPYLENCTVDASIKYFVAKLVRAHGGCLGTRSR